MSYISKVKCSIIVIQIIFQKLFSYILYLLTYFSYREYRNPTAFYVIFWVAFQFSWFILFKNLQSSWVRLRTVPETWRCSFLLPSNTVTPSDCPIGLHKADLFGSTQRVNQLIRGRLANEASYKTSCYLRLPISFKSTGATSLYWYTSFGQHIQSHSQTKKLKSPEAI